MDPRVLVALLALLFAGWGHLLLHDMLGAQALWERIDGCFPAPMRSPADVAGGSLLALGGLGVMLTIVA